MNFQSLRYKLNVVHNETDSNLISKAETLSLYQFKLNRLKSYFKGRNTLLYQLKLLIKRNMINKYKDTCEESNCYVCNL